MSLFLSSFSLIHHLIESVFAFLLSWSFFSEKSLKWLQFFLLNLNEVFFILLFFALFKQYPFFKPFLGFFRFLPFSPQARETLACGFACALPAYLMSEKIVEEKERRYVQFVLPFVNCSGRFVPLLFVLTSSWNDLNWWSGFFLTCFFLFLIYGFNLCFLIFGHLLWVRSWSWDLKAKDFVFSYGTHIPSFFSASRSACQQVKSFLKLLGWPLFFVLVGFLFFSWIDWPPFWKSWGERVARGVADLFQLTGLNETAIGFLLAGFISRETMALLIQGFLATFDQHSLIAVWGFPSVLSFLVWIAYTPHCLPSFLVFFRTSRRSFFVLSAFLIQFLFAFLLSSFFFYLTQLLI